MKKIFLALCLVLVAFSVHARAIQEEVSLAEEKAQVSYAAGMILGAEISPTGLELDYAAFTEGFKTAMEKGKTKFTEEEAIELVQTALEAAKARQSAENQAKEEFFLAANGSRPEVTTTASGLQYEALTVGKGDKPLRTDKVKVNYEGTLIDGTVFDSSYQRGEPTEFPLDGVITGWAEGLQLMNVGSKYKLYIPSKLAYGERGAGSGITPYSTLIFTVELLEIVKPEAQVIYDAD